MNSEIHSKVVIEQVWRRNWRPRLSELRDVLGVTALGYVEVLGNNGRTLRSVWKELCYGKTETLGDAEKAVRGWRYNLVR